jgi:hypothetical protein
MLQRTKTERIGSTIFGNLLKLEDVALMFVDKILHFITG